MKPIGVIFQGGNSMGRLLLIQESGDMHTPDELLELHYNVDEAFRSGMSDEGLVNIIRNAGFNFWFGMIGSDLHMPTVDELKDFEFTPKNIDV